MVELRQLNIRALARPTLPRLNLSDIETVQVFTLALLFPFRRGMAEQQGKSRDFNGFFVTQLSDKENKNND